MDAEGRGDAWDPEWIEQEDAIARDEVTVRNVWVVYGALHGAQ